MFGKQRIELSVPGNYRIQWLDSKIIVQQAQYGYIWRLKTNEEIAGSKSVDGHSYD